MSKHELLAAHLRGFEDHRCNLAADALEAQAREIEGLRKQDEALILQLVEALENFPGGRSQAITAGRARLEGKP